MKWIGKRGESLEKLNLVGKWHRITPHRHSGPRLCDVPSLSPSLRIIQFYLFSWRRLFSFYFFLSLFKFLLLYYYFMLNAAKSNIYMYFPFYLFIYLFIIIYFRIYKTWCNLISPCFSPVHEPHIFLHQRRIITDPRKRKKKKKTFFF